MRTRTHSESIWLLGVSDIYIKREICIRGLSIRGMKFKMAASASRISVQIHCTARNLTLDVSVGKSTLKTVSSWKTS